MKHKKLSITVERQGKVTSILVTFGKDSLPIKTKTDSDLFDGLKKVAHWLSSKHIPDEQIEDIIADLEATLSGKAGGIASIATKVTPKGVLIKVDPGTGEIEEHGPITCEEDVTEIVQKVTSSLRGAVGAETLREEAIVNGVMSSIGAFWEAIKDGTFANKEDNKDVSPEEEKKDDLSPHQTRVLEEYLTLDKKALNIVRFVDGDPIFPTLPEEEQLLLLKQAETMSHYLDILAERLLLWDIVVESEVEDYLDELSSVGGSNSDAGESTPTHKELHVKSAKSLRVELDSTLQKIKEFKNECQGSPCIDSAPFAFDNPPEVPANTQLAIRHVEDAIMRLGMTLKAIGNPTPYPESYNPNSSKVEPTADGLKF